MIGIIFAMEIELEAVKKHTELNGKKRIGSIDFDICTINGKECVLALCGIGKVAAAMCTQTMILGFSPDLIINVGVAGGIGKGIKIGDVVIADSVLQHDYDTSPIGDKKGEISGLRIINIPSSKEMCERLLSYKPEDFSMFKGAVMSGDQFIANKSKLKQLKTEFGGIACDMEAGAIGQVCYINKVPFAVIRAISDNADDEAGVAYDNFMEDAANHAASIIFNIL